MGILGLFIWLVIVPFGMGVPFTRLVGENKRRITGAFSCGYIAMWALFELITVPIILTTNDFNHVVWIFGIASVILASLGVFYAVLTRKDKWESVSLKLNRNVSDKDEKINQWLAIGVWVLFLLLFAFQCYKGCTMAFADGDDAFYIPISLTSEASGKMYHVVPYTGETSTLDTRHGLAPFPIWIAFLGAVSGIHTTIIAQVILTVVLLLLCYVIYASIARYLFKNRPEGIPYFMLLVAILHLFGNYSFYTSATFLITRTSQGKAVLGNIIFPFLLLVLLLLSEEYHQDRELALVHRKPELSSDKRKVGLAVLLILGTVAAWLCSSMGAFLAAVLLGVCGAVMAIWHRSWRAILQSVACALPCGIFAVIYLLMK